MSKIVFYKLIFFGSVFILTLLSLYPGNLIGQTLYGDQSTFSGSNNIYHFISYLFTSTFGFLAYYKKKFLSLLLFLLILSFFLEVLQLWIPNRSFEFLDLISNLSGVLLSFFLFVILQKKYFKISF